MDRHKWRNAMVRHKWRIPRLVVILIFLIVGIPYFVIWTQRSNEIERACNGYRDSVACAIAKGDKACAWMAGEPKALLQARHVSTCSPPLD
jgi:hypothetical protein